MKNIFKKEKKQISIFITAGYPNTESTINQIIMLQKAGIDFIELGIPFSDPMADGPVIQETSNVSIENGMSVELLFELLSKNQDKISAPLVIMGYLNPIFHYGLENFLKKCKEVNIRHLIIPDISLEVYEKYYQSFFEQFGITLCFLVTPLTSNERIQKMAKISSDGFIYLVSQNSITGENKEVNLGLEKRYMEIKKLCLETPLMIGFGIKNREDIQKGQKFADGAIIGSAYLKAVKLKNEVNFLNEITTCL